MLADWERCKTETKSELLVLEALPGFGKTRLVQEFYAELAHSQPRPAYWPTRLETSAVGSLKERRRIVPARFVKARNSRPSFAWIGISCYLDEEGEPARSLVRAVDETTTQHESVLTEWLRLRQMARVVGSLAVTMIGLLVAVAGLLGFGGTPVAIVGCLVAGISLFGLREPLREFAAMRAASSRRHKDTEIDYAVHLKHLSKGARDRADDLLKALRAKRLPIAMIVDDATWADEDTVGLVDELLRREYSVLVVATLRPDPFEQQIAARTGLGGLVTRYPNKTKRVVVQRLEDEAAEQLVRSRAPRTDAIVVEAFTKRAAGNPLSLRVLMETESVARSLDHNQYQLSDPTTELNSIPLDYDGIFDGAFARLPAYIRQLLVISSVHGQLVETETATSGFRAICPNGPEGAQLFALACDEHGWLSLFDQYVDQFADTAFHDTAVRERQRYTVVLGSDLETSRRAMWSTIRDRRNREATWFRLSETARRVLLAVEVEAVVDQIVSPDEVAVAAALELADLLDAPGEGRRVARLGKLAMQWTLRDEHMDRALGLQAAGMLRAGRPGEAVQPLQRQVAYRERRFGTDGAETLRSKADLSLALSDAGRFTEAISQFQRVISVAENVFGSTAAETIRIENGLATALTRVGRPQEALARCQSLLQRLESYPAESKDVVETKDQLAFALRESGHLNEAISAYTDLLLLRTRVQGPDHPATLFTRDDLAYAYTRAGRPDVALEQCRTLLLDRSRVLGPEHPETLRTRDNLAIALRASGSTSEAIEEYRRVLRERERVLGPDHPDTLTTRNGLAGTLLQASRVAEATNEYATLLTDRKRLLGPLSRSTLETRCGLARAILVGGNPAEAIRRFRELLRVQTASLGDGHPDLLITRRGIADSRLADFRMTEATADYEQLIADQVALLGRHHPDVLDTRRQLCSALLKKGEHDKARELLQALASDEKLVNGQTDPSTQALLSSLPGR
jgi:tetratricopeptide (TPR) repeat protein